MEEASEVINQHRKRLRRFHEPGQAHELTFSCYQGMPLLNRDRTRKWLVQALDRARRKWNIQLWAYVIMPEHAHLLIYPTLSECDIGAVLKSMKQSVARRAVNYLRLHAPHWLDRLKITRPTGRVEHRFWQQGSGYDRNIVEAATAWKVVDYIHCNPVRRGLVECTTDWLWSSARWYERLDGVLLAMDRTPPRAG